MTHSTASNLPFGGICSRTSQQLGGQRPPKLCKIVALRIKISDSSNSACPTSGYFLGFRGQIFAPFSLTRAATGVYVVLSGESYLSSYIEYSIKMSRSFVSRLPRGDTLVAVGIPLGCAGLLVEAYYRTDLRDAESARDCRYGPSSLLIENQHARTLERDGIVIIPNALSPQQLSDARAELNHLYQRRRRQGSEETAQQSGDGAKKINLERTSNDRDVRQDVVAWINTIESNNDFSGLENSPHLGHCVRLIRGITHALEQFGYRRRLVGGHFDDDNLATPQNEKRNALAVTVVEHKVPQNCQLALYQGDESAGYARHLDQCNSSFSDLGLLEWWRLSDYRQRAITTILYLNEADRPASEGGLLRCWVETRESQNSTQKDKVSEFHTPFDILPQGGTLVIFQSDRVEHQVLPSSSDRSALTNWVVDQA